MLIYRVINLNVDDNGQATSFRTILIYMVINLTSQSA